MSNFLVIFQAYHFYFGAGFALFAIPLSVYFAHRNGLESKIIYNIIFLVAMFGFCLSLLIYDEEAAAIYKYWGLFVALVAVSLPCVFFLYDMTSKWFQKHRVENPVNYYEIYLKRSYRLEKEARLILVGIVALIIGSSIVFFKADFFAADDFRNLYGSGVINRMVFFFTGKNVFVSDVYPLALLIGLRIGDVAVASFLTFMLIRVYRYNLRLAAFFLSRADAIYLAENSRFKEVPIEVLPVLLDANFDFGGDHPTLVDGFARLLEALNPKKKEDK